MRLSWHDGAAYLEPDPKDATLRQGSVMVVDDNAVVVKVMALQLEDWGYAVTRAHGAEAALLHFDPNATEAVVTNLSLAGLGGLGLLTEVHRRAVHVPVIVLVSRLESAEVLAAMRRGAFDCIVLEEVPIVRQVLVGEPPADAVDPFRAAVTRAVNHSRLVSYGNLLNAQLSRSNAELKAEQRRLTETLETLKQTQASLVQAEKAAGLVAATHGVANAIKTPLAVLDAGLGLLREWVTAVLAGREPPPAVTDDLPSILEDIDTNLERISDTVEGMHRLAKTGAVYLKKVELTEVAKAVVLEQQSRAPDGVELRLSTSKTPPARANPEMVAEVLRALVENGLEACGDAGRRGSVTVRLFAADGRPSIEVKDDGEGIPEEDRERVFDPFFTTRGKRHAKGLGLTLARELATRMHGSLALVSAAGCGTTVTVALEPWRPD
ncbi:MAG: hybrid sensor histidine kinase/response regulator [Deltaproteobacteria bacterium]|nr:hybrid sensor histidine kinase/response regulator [Deltaproteobacteria bacterium]